MIPEHEMFCFSLHFESQFFSLFHDLSDSFWMTVFDTFVLSIIHLYKVSFLIWGRLV